MRIAVVGGGVSGLVAAHSLHRAHEVTVFEAGAQAGGHALTVGLELDGAVHPVDLGFIVYNETTYPEFTRLLARLGVATRPSDMSFGFRCERSGVEWSGGSLSALFAQPSNLFRPSFLRMLRDVVRFNRRAPGWVEAGADAPTLGALLDRNGFSREFRERYLVPMGAAIWSSTPERLLDLPAAFFVRFFRNHGLLGTTGHLRWRTIVDGSRRYVEALTRPFADRIRFESPVRRVRRVPGGVEVVVEGGPPERFDQVVIGAHADQALAMVEDPTPLEQEILGRFPYQRNRASVHVDERVLPRAARARASWNYLARPAPAEGVSVTYDLTRLQGLGTRRPLLESLNLDDALDGGSVLRRDTFEHPVFTTAGVAAQARWAEVSGRDRIHYCGAYWRNGFHEDGVVSGLAVARALGEGLA